MLGYELDGKYRLLRQVGAGGMGSVYEAEALETKARVAVKVVTPTDKATDSTLIRRFHREARAASSVDSPHIGQILDTGTDPTSGVPYMVMEFLEGEDLAGAFKRVGVLPTEVTLRVAKQALLGLQPAHAAGVVHRDIKPANIFLARAAGGGGKVTVKILDFGVAKMKRDQAITAETAGLTRTGSMIGSPLYMSPEQARGSKVIDERADIWSLGIVMFEALTGRTPYQHIDALGELILAICSPLPPVVQDYAPWVPREVARIVHRALSLDADVRQQTAAEMLAEVDALLPDGYELHESMFQPLDEEARSVVAPRLELGAAAAHSGGSGYVHRVQLDSGAYDRTVHMDSSGAGAARGATDTGTHRGLTQSVPSGGRTSGLVAAAALGALAFGAVGAYFAFGPPSDAATAPGPERADSAAGPGSAAEPGSAAGEETDVVTKEEAPSAPPTVPPGDSSGTSPSPTTDPLPGAPSATPSAPLTASPKKPPAPHRPPPDKPSPPPATPGTSTGLDTSGFGDRK